MPSWVSALAIAILVVVIPFTLILKLMLQLPKSVALSHRRWPPLANIGIIRAITAYTTIFIRSAYYGRIASPVTVLMEFVIAALAYVFGMVLLVPHFAVLYTDYPDTTAPRRIFLTKT